MTVSGRWGVGEHPADLLFWAEASSLPAVYATAAAGLAQLMVDGPRRGRRGERNWRELALTAEDPVALLVGLLGEVIYIIDGEGLLPIRLEITRLTPTRLDGRLRVIPLDPARHRPGEPVKAATLHQASLVASPRGWRGQLVLDV